MIANRLLRCFLRTVYFLGGENLCTKLVQVYRSKAPHALEKLELHLSHTCNYQCTYCYVDKNTTSLTEDDWLTVIGHAKALGVKKIALLGGEPLLSASLWVILDKIKSLHMQPFIYTNGSLLAAEMIRRLKTYDPLLVVKYDANDALYKLHTQQSRFSLSHIEENIRACRHNGLRVITFTPLLKDNSADIAGIVSRSLALGTFPVFERYVAVASAEVNAMFELSDEAYALATEQAEAVIRDFLTKKGLPFIAASGGCACYKKALSVTASGEVLPCPFLPEKFSLGNVLTEDLNVIYKLFKIKQKQEYTPAARCLACTSFKQCDGGCKTHSYFKHGVLSGHCHPESFALHCGFALVDSYGDITSSIWQ